MKLHIMCVLWIAQCECFIRLPSDHNVHFKDEIVVDVKEGKRTKRSAVNDFHPKSYDLDFETDGKGVHLNLIRNDGLQTNVPTLLLNDNGLQEQRLEDTEESVFYQDSQHGAAFVVQYNERSKNMFGIFNTEKGKYILQSSDVNTSVHRQGFSKFEIMKEKHEQVEYGDYLHDDDSFRTSKNHNIHKRATGDNQIELLIVCDYAIYEHWYVKSTKPTQSDKETDALTTVRQFYAFVINGMDAMYKNIQTSSYTISILFAGIVIAQSLDNSTWTETIKNTTFTPNRVDAPSALSNFNNWITTTSGLPGNDHAMLFTRYDLTSSGSTGIVGLAYLGQFCTDTSQSIVEDGFDFMIITTASHELGHSLNAGHDGDPSISCSAADAYIMAPSSSPQRDAATATHPWTFSACSTSSFSSYIDSLVSNCMKTLSSGFDPTALSPYDQSIAGQVYDADAQCAEIYNSSSYMCRSQYTNDFSTICNVLWCYDPSTEATCRTHIAGEGTLCGSQKWCVSGLCTANSSAPSGNDACLYGDRKGTITNNGLTCADIAPDYCDQVPLVCCGSCAPETTTQMTTTQSDTTSIITTAQSETTTQSVTTTQAETSTPEVTTTQADTTTSEITTTQAETTILDATTSQIDNTTSEITTTQDETSTPDVTTTQVDTTTQAETTTPGVTTTQVETTTSEITTTQTEILTSEITTTQAVTTKPNITTQAETSKLEITTTQAETSTTEVTTTPVKTSTPEITTTQAETSTPEVTTKQADTTTTGMTTTLAVTTTLEMATIQARSTTLEVTTTEAKTSTAEMTTQVGTPELTRPQPETTTPEMTKTQAETITQAVTTTQADITTHDVTTTEHVTTKQDATTTQAQGTTTEVDTIVDDSAKTQELILIGTGAAVAGIIILGIGIACLVVYCRRLNKSDTYPAYLAASHTNAGTEYDEIVDTWAERKSQRSTEYDEIVDTRAERKSQRSTEYDEIVDTSAERMSQRSGQYRHHMMNYQLGHSSSGRSRQTNTPARYPQYNMEDRISWNKFNQKGVNKNRAYDNSGYY